MEKKWQRIIQIKSVQKISYSANRKFLNLCYHDVVVILIRLDTKKNVITHSKGVRGVVGNSKAHWQECCISSRDMSFSLQFSQRMRSATLENVLLAAILPIIRILLSSSCSYSVSNPLHGQTI